MPSLRCHQIRQVYTLAYFLTVMEIAQACYKDPGYAWVLSLPPDRSTEGHRDAPRAGTAIVPARDVQYSENLIEGFATPVRDAREQ
jgi:hypothetical protein